MVIQAGIGIDLGGTSLKYGIVDIARKVHWESKRPSKAKTSRREIEENILESANEALIQAESLGINIQAIGIGTPGVVNGAGLVLGGSPNLAGWDQVPLAKILQEATGLPAVAANDADMMAIGETHAAGGEATTAIFITLGTGIGGAMIIKGELFTGHFGLGGEMGVIPMLIDGKVYSWEDVASTTALVKRYRETRPEKEGEIDGKYIIQKYWEGEELAKESLEYFSQLVGMGIAAFINIFNPEMIIIGGGISEAGDFLIEKIKTHSFRYALKPCQQGVKILRASLGNRAGFMGAGMYALSQYPASP
ncbi:MAG: ROK family protein [Bacteroidia bacterium]|nr:ROK family protein [Bacteroidia bacterium]